MRRTQETLGRRKHKRFQVAGDAFVIIRCSDTVIGRITDISMVGLNFEYLLGQGQSIVPTEMEILVAQPAKPSFHLKHLPCRAIWNLTTWKNPLGWMERKRCGAQFGEMTEAQKASLVYLIENFTTFDCQETDAKMAMVLC